MEAEDEAPKQNGHSENEDHNEFFIEPEPLRAALMSEEVMEILNSYTPGTLGRVYCCYGYNDTSHGYHPSSCNMLVCPTL